MAAYASLVSLMHVFANLQRHPRPPISRPPISLNKDQVDLLTQKIAFLQEFLEGYNPYLGHTTEADPFESRIANTAHATEDLIEILIQDQTTLTSGFKMSSNALYRALERLIQKMALIEEEAKQIKQNVGVKHQLHTESMPSPRSSSSSSSMAQQSRMVGADDVLLEMKDKLRSDRRDLQIIPIVGMGGSGKTTLARNIYQDPLIKEHFHICAWVTISQEYSIPRILKQLLNQLDHEGNQNLDELGDMLHKHLFGRKYLIILDDMWNIEAWEGVKIFLPNSKNGSRIVITTRLSDLASQITLSNSLGMKLLDDAKSWELLSKTVFGEKDCPLELKEIGKKIGKSCKGLPLSIVVVGGLLAKSKHTREFWKHIEKNLSTIVNSEDDERCLKILHMSYKQLPVYLKPCFLYMGHFFEDQIIHTSVLIKIWVVDGFLKPVSGKSLEEIATLYLEELTHRNLVLIHKKGITGKIKQCMIHDALRDMCLKEVEKERFCSVMDGHGPSSSTPQGILNGRCRRLAIHVTTSKEQAKEVLKSSMLLLRSLTYDVNEKLPRLSFRLLRILKSGARFPKNLGELTNSRFLASSTTQRFNVPSSVWLFWNLQTLIAENQDEFTAPIDMWCMPHIRHLQFKRFRLLDPPNGQDDVVLENLQTLGIVLDFKCSAQVVKKIPNIKKLKVCYDKEVVDDTYGLTNLDCLDKLESFTCIFTGNANGSLESLINFPHSLIKLDLEIDPSQYWEDVLDNIGALPLLQKLTLSGGSFKQGQWETTECQFRSLKFLSIDCCEGLHVWITESSHFPCLERLLVSRVHKLKEIPLDFAEILTLEVIEVSYCSESTVVSAKSILVEQEELYGETALRVQVKILWEDATTILESLASPNFHVKVSY